MKTAIVYTLSLLIIVVLILWWFASAVRVQACCEYWSGDGHADAVITYEPGIYEQALEDGYGIVGFPGDLRVVPEDFAEGFLAVAECESGYDTNAVGALGELGILQILPLNFPWMRRLVWNPYSESDRIAFAAYYWQIAGWSPWSCAYKLGMVQ